MICQWKTHCLGQQQMATNMLCLSVSFFFKFDLRVYALKNKLFNFQTFSTLAMLIIKIKAITILNINWMERQ